MTLTDGASIAGIVGAVLAVVIFLRPTRRFLSRWRFFNSWIITSNEREKIQRMTAQKEVEQRDKEEARHANLEFELRRNGSIELVIHNVGRCAARDVVIWGFLSPGLYGYDMHSEMTQDGFGLVGSYGTIPAGGSRSDDVSAREYQIECGATQWSLRANWRDDVGEHRDEARLATRWG
jgi:hypothetical protein